MLNETWRLLQALRAAQINVPSQHPLIRPLPKSERNLLRVRLDKSGRVAAVEDVAESERSGIRRIIKTSDGSFPVLKVNRQLLDVPASDKSRTEADSISLLSLSMAVHPVRKWRDAGWQWADSLKKAAVCRRILKNENGGNDIGILGQRLELALASDDHFTTELVRQAVRALEQGRLSSLQTVRELLIGKRKKGTTSTSNDQPAQEGNLSVLLVLDLDQALGGGVYGAKSWERVAALFPTDAAARDRIHVHLAGASAFGGDGELLREPFPQVKLPCLEHLFRCCQWPAMTTKRSARSGMD